MPSFDIVSELDRHELTNGVDQANREVTTRFDFKDSGAQFEVTDTTIELTAQSEFQLQQMLTILHAKLVKRGIDLLSLEEGKPQMSGRTARQTITLKQGIDQPTGKKIVALVKDSKLKVQAAINGDQVRVTGKQRDDLQAVMQMLRQAPLDVPIQFNNFRD